MIDRNNRSVHLDHSGVEVGAVLDLAGVVADAADCNYVDPADQPGDQTAEAHDPSRACHEILECVVAVLQLREALCIKIFLPLLSHSLMSLKRRK